MTSIFPTDDNFTENATHYGASLRSYIRLLPWKTAGDTVTGLAIPMSRGDLHNGYSGAGGGIGDMTAPQLAAFRSHTGTGTTPSFCCVLWRQAYLARARVGVSFRLLPVTGAVNAAAFAYVGVTARNTGGLYDETVDGSLGSQHHNYDNNGYWFILGHNPGGAVTGSVWLLLRINVGVITILATQGGTTPTDAVNAAFVGTHLMELTVDDVGGNPVLTGKYEGATVISFTDTSASKLTAAGRCGFGLTRDRQTAGPINSVHVAAYFEVFDLALNGTLVRDAWDRVNLNANINAVDGNGVDGKMLMSLWTLDIYGPTTYLFGSNMLRDPAGNRIRANTQLYNFSQIQANDLYSQHRSAIFLTTDPGTSRTDGIVVRASFNTAGNIATGYRVRIVQTTATKVIFITRSPGGDLASRNVLSGWGLTFGTDFKLRVEIDNVGGTGPDNGTPGIKAYINDIQVTAWTTLQSGITNGATGEVLDGQSGAILGGPAQGTEINGTPSTTMFVDEWKDELGAPTDIGDEDHISIPVTAECDGKTGTFTLIYDWPVECTPTYRSDEHDYDSGHVNRILRSPKLRRIWRIGAQAVTDAERASLITFWDSHKGVQIPFDFPDPEKPSVNVCAHFLRKDLGTILRNPNVHSFDIEIEELLDTV